MARVEPLTVLRTAPADHYAASPATLTALQTITDPIARLLEADRIADEVTPHGELMTRLRAERTYAFRVLHLSHGWPGAVIIRGQDAGPADGLEEVRRGE